MQVTFDVVYRTYDVGFNGKIHRLEFLMLFVFVLMV